MQRNGLPHPWGRSFLALIITCINLCCADVVRLDDGNPGEQFMAALGSLRNMSVANLTILIPPGAVVNISGLQVDKPGGRDLQSGLIRIQGESAKQLSVLDLGFLADATVRLGFFWAILVVGLVNAPWPRGACTCPGDTTNKPLHLHPPTVEVARQLYSAP